MPEFSAAAHGASHQADAARVVQRRAAVAGDAEVVDVRGPVDIEEGHVDELMRLERSGMGHLELLRHSYTQRRAGLHPLFAVPEA